jgi:hypothetical protein
VRLFFGAEGVGDCDCSIHPIRKSVEKVPKGKCFLVFYVRQGLEKKYGELKKRGVSFVGGIENEPRV